MREAFRNNFIDGVELGASLVVHVDGMRVVDLSAGHRDESRRVPWTPDTLVNAFSVGKGIISVLVAAAVQSGRLDYDDRVSTHWPAFAVDGKDALTLTELLGHRAGLPALRDPLVDEDLFDWDRMCSLLAATEPWWTPGSTHGYHVNTFGYLVGEVLRRSTRLTVAEHLAELATPLGADVWFGVPHLEHGRIADLSWEVAVPAATPSTGPSGAPPPDESTRMRLAAYANPPGFSGIGLVNGSRWRSAVHPSTNLHATASGVAAIHLALLDVNGPLSLETRDRAVEEVSAGLDAVLGSPTRFGRGFQLPREGRGFGPNPEAFGHFGAGGSLGFTDPVANVAFGYVMNRMGSGWQNERNRALVDALYSCL